MKTKHTVLIVDDESEYAWLISEFLKTKGFRTLVAETATQGLALVESGHPDIVLLDINLPDLSGVDTVKEIRSTHESLPVIMVSALGEMKTVVEAMQAGATDYLHKPLPSFEDVSQKIQTYLQPKPKLAEEFNVKRRDKFTHIIGESPATRQLIREIAKVAESDSTVMLRGESDTGKSMIAELIHQNSPRKLKPFVTINCAAIPPNLLESELFGHERGSSTGAIQEKIGKFEQAHDGTVFLDEIGDLGSELQVKILRVLQSGELERVGGLATIKVDVRIIAATNRDLESLIEKKHFRQDFYYRLNVLPIHVPALKERNADIPELIRHFLKIECEKQNKHFEKLTDAIMQEFTRYPWPGNIRELQNSVERAVVFGKPPHFKLSDFNLKPISSLETAPQITLSESTSLREIEHQALLHSLEQNSGNISKTAKALGISRETIYRRLRKTGIDNK